MPIKKLSKKDLAVDSTAICDVAFLLLSFFILTSNSRESTNLIQTNRPAISSHIISDNFDLIPVNVIIKRNKVYLKIDDNYLKKQVLIRMKTKYGVKLTGEEVSRFGNISSFGDSIKSLKHFIDNFRTITEKDMQGIPIDETKKNEFSNWLSEIQSVDQNNNGFKCKFQIDADQAETYHIIELVIRNLQFHDINQFSLLTRPAMRSRR